MGICQDIFFYMIWVLLRNVIFVLCVDRFGLFGFVNAAAGLERLIQWCVLMGRLFEGIEN